MVKSLVAAVAPVIGLAGYAVAQEAVHRHHYHHPHHMLQPGPSPGLQPEPSPEALNDSIYWSPAGGNRGFYSGR
jgi:hypothetical protein